VYGPQTELDALSQERLQRLVPVREGNSIRLLGNGDIESHVTGCVAVVIVFFGAGFRDVKADRTGSRGIARVSRLSALAFAGRFDSNEKFVPFDVIASCSWPSAREGLVQQFEVDDLVGLHQEPVGKWTTAGAGGLIPQQLNRSVEDAVIVRFEDALLVVVHQPEDACLFDSTPDFRNRFEQRHL